MRERCQRGEIPRHEVCCGPVKGNITASEKINDFKRQYFQARNPVFSIDTKANEFLGQLYRTGRLWTQEATRAFDHDFPSWATGLVIPHGIFDLTQNCGNINLGLSHDTILFACELVLGPDRQTLPRRYFNAVAVRRRQQQQRHLKHLQGSPAIVGQWHRN